MSVTLSESGEPMITVSWVERELAIAADYIVSGRPDYARMQITTTMDTLELIVESLRSPAEPSGGV